MKTLLRVRLVATCVFATLCLFPAMARAEGKTRNYYVAVDEIEWDYTPLGVDQMMGMPFDKMAAMYVESGKHQIGRVYRKAVYREYTDATFTTLKKRPPEWEHLGLLGPVLHAEVGDTIQVFFKNNGTKTYSMHPHGVLYEKSSEGSYYKAPTTMTARTILLITESYLPAGPTPIYGKCPSAPAQGPTTPVRWSGSIIPTTSKGTIPMPV